MTDCIINGGAGEEAPAGEPFRVTYCTDKGEETTHLRILDVEDDSMEPEIREGDWVVVDLASRLPEAGGAFLLRDGERLVARRVEAVRDDGAEEDERLGSGSSPTPPAAQRTSRSTTRCCGWCGGS